MTHLKFSWRLLVCNSFSQAKINMNRPPEKSNRRGLWSRAKATIHLRDVPHKPPNGVKNAGTCETGFIPLDVALLGTTPILHPA